MQANDLIKDYIVSICIATRNHPDVYLGVSPQGGVWLFTAASQAFAALRTRDYVIPDDVKAMAKATLTHRLIISPAARIQNIDPSEVVQEILNAVPVPKAHIQ